jgi:hypothetical protein
MAAIYLPSMAPPTFQGTVINAHGGYITVYSAGQELRFAVSPDTKILLDGREATMYDVEPNFRAHVAAMRRDNFWIARRVVVSSHSAQNHPINLTRLLALGLDAR